MALQKKVSGFFALFSGLGILFFSCWFFSNFREDQLITSLSGVPHEYGINPNSQSGVRKAVYFELKFLSSPYAPGIRVMSKDFNSDELSKSIAGKKELTVYFQPKQNADGINEVYQVRQNGKIIYTFDERFNPDSNGNFFGWFSLVVGGILVVFGLFSLLIKR